MDEKHDQTVAMLNDESHSARPGIDNTARVPAQRVGAPASLSLSHHELLPFFRSSVVQVSSVLSVTISF